MRKDFALITEKPSIRVKIRNPTTRPVKVQSICVEADSELHFGDGNLDLNLQLNPNEERTVIYVGAPGPSGFDLFRYQAKERPILLTFPYIEPSITGGGEKTMYSTLALSAKPRGAMVAILFGGLCGLLYLRDDNYTCVHHF